MEKLKTGYVNRLKVVKSLDFGMYLDGLDKGEVLLPRQYIPAHTAIGSEIDVFIYNDSEDRIIATTLIPKVQAGECAFLRVISITTVGAFLDWGLPKDLLMPYREMKSELKPGHSCPVYVYLDNKTGRLAASERIENFMNATPPDYEPEQAVSLFIYKKTDIGFKAVINNSHTGVIHFSDVFKTIRVGDTMTGYIRKIKDQGKIDLILQRPGYSQVDPIAEMILNKLEENHGFLALSDNSGADEIYSQLGISKKLFKKSVGLLYKKRLLQIEQDGIRLITK